MTRARWQSRIARWLPIALGLAASSVTLVTVGLMSASPWWLFRVPLDLVATASIRRRRWRFGAAVWFGVNGFAFVGSMAASAGRNGANLGAAVAFTATALAILWPRLRSQQEHAPLPALPGTWVLLSTLAVVVMNALLLTVGNRELVQDPQQALVQSGAATLLLFGCLMIASLTGRARWLFQIGGTLLAGAASLAHASALRDAGGSANPALDISWLLGAVPFALGFDWIRSGCTSLRRVARATVLCFIPAFIPAVLASPQQAFAVQVVAVALGRALAFGICAGLAPRVRGRFRTGYRTQPPFFGWAPRGLMVLSLLLVCVPVGFGLFTGEIGFVVAGAVFSTTMVFGLVLRTRVSRAFLWLAFAIPVCSAGVVTTRSGGWQALWLAPLAILVGVSCLLARTKTNRHFARRWRPTLNPAPRASAALAAAGLAVATLAVALTSRTPQARAQLLARVEGPTALNQPLMFRPPTLNGTPARESEVGSSIALDPLGRGNWVVDQETNAIRLVNGNALVRSIAVGAGPEQLVIDNEGRVFVSCRQAGRIDVIDPDFTLHSIEVGTEVRGLALDAGAHRLYAGLLLERELWAIDTRTRAVVGRRSMDVEPRTLAMTPQGVAVLPDRGGSVTFVQRDLSTAREVPLFSTAGQNWHGQALLPLGRDLVVIHEVVNTGLSQPVSTGGYGGSVRQPVELVASVLVDGEPVIYPPALDDHRAIPGSEITGAALGCKSLLLASMGTGEILEVPLSSLYTAHSEVSRRVPIEGPMGLAHSGQGSWVTLAAFSRNVVDLEPAVGTSVQVSLGRGKLDAEMALGRQLFHLTNSRAISSAQLACATCHPDGREDGLVWRLQGLRLQTPSLAGRLADTAPYNWHGSEPTLEGNVAQTIRRLGGTGLTEQGTHALARFIREGFAEPHRRDIGPNPLVAQGSRLFHDDKVGCSGCHLSDAAFTDGARHDVGSLSEQERKEIQVALDSQTRAEARKDDPLPAVDLRDATRGFDTPSLRDVALTAPYFHDGSAPTLEALLENNRDRMGHTSQLTPSERAALVAYLKTL